MPSGPPARRWAFSAGDLSRVGPRAPPSEQETIMASTSSPITDQRRGSDAGPGQDTSRPLVWQRTDTVGTEVVFPCGSDPRTATGCAVVAGVLPYTTRWHCELDTDSRVRAL